ncbi:MAG: hypothetical protein AAFO91_14300, partial [Bacteroidota bacterium]
CANMTFILSTELACKKNFIKKANFLILYEKAVRLEEDHPRRVAVTDSVGERLKSVQTFRSQARETLLQYQTLSTNITRIPLNPTDTPSWKRELNDSITILPNLYGMKSRGD